MDNKCNHITKKQRRCGRTASHRINCKLLCWQHAKLYKVFEKKGDKCNYKLLQKFEAIRRPYTGLGIVGKVTGISGSISVPSIFKIFKTMYQPNTCFVDIGAADGYMLISAILFGYKYGSGIEYQSGNTGLKNIFSATWTKLQKDTDFLTHNWSRQKPNIKYNTNIATINLSINTLHPSNRGNMHVFTFWDGFSYKDSISLLTKLKNTRVTRGCFVCRRSREFGTYEKLKNECNIIGLKINEILSLTVNYKKEKYNAIIVRLL